MRRTRVAMLVLAAAIPLIAAGCADGLSGAQRNATLWVKEAEAGKHTNWSVGFTGCKGTHREMQQNKDIDSDEVNQVRFVYSTGCLVYRNHHYRSVYVNSNRDPGYWQVENVYVEDSSRSD